MVKTIDERMNELIKDPSMTKEQWVFFENRMWENLVLSDTKVVKYLFLFTMSSIIWFLAKSASIDKLNFFGTELVNLNILLLALPPISAFFLYQISCVFMYSTIINLIIARYYIFNYQPLKKRELTELLIPPTLHYIENAITNMLEEGSLSYKTSALWRVILSLFIFYIPLTFLVWMMYSLLISPNITLLSSILINILVLFFVARSLSVVFNAGLLLIRDPESLETYKEYLNIFKKH